MLAVKANLPIYSKTPKKLCGVTAPIRGSHVWALLIFCFFLLCVGVLIYVYSTATCDDTVHNATSHTMMLQ